ncbi:hypothetical protein CEE63_03170 [Stenotrophomonas maltophilia]|uniref:Uncharacterized protein n=2 Tax=Stenotrophomonas maltophilia TaxID=40324 RepID=A0A246IDC5_STEMA|nr:hypothetical protein CEE63_03170 [Stenotrophomonas maltophilia]
MAYTTSTKSLFLLGMTASSLRNMSSVHASTSVIDCTTFALQTVFLGYLRIRQGCEPSFVEELSPRRLFG